MSRPGGTPVSHARVPGDDRMEGTPGRGASAETEIDWERSCAFVRRRLDLELPSAARGNADDLVQECMVRLLRVVRRERVENVEALLTQLARRTAIDFLRRRTRWSALVLADDEAIAQSAAPGPGPDEPGDPVERVRFVVLEYFTARDARCRELAAAFFDEQDWKVVAAAHGRSHDVVRKQWSRCLELLRAAARGEPGSLLRWTRIE